MTVCVKDLYVNYGNIEILTDISFDIKSGEIVTLIGPNGSGKSTLIKTICRIIKPQKGKVLFEGKDIFTLDTKAVARKISVLPQVKKVASDVTVERLVQYGRYPHLKFGNRMTKSDEEIIDWAIEKTNISKFRDRYINTLSGGEKQRAWIAMALAQKPEVLILDEPTTYLDISYQLEVLELIRELNKSLKLTIIMVLHDLNQAVRYSDRVMVLQNGRLFNFGDAKSILNKNLINEVFNIDVDIQYDNRNDCPYFISNKMQMNA